MKLLSAYIAMLVLTLVFIIFYLRNYLSKKQISFVSAENNFENELKELLQCYDKPLKFTVRERTDYWIFQNFVSAEKTHKCHESITYTTVGDVSHIDNLIPIVERWQGPVSAALHASGSDFFHVINSIAYLRNCESPLLKKFVTFHIVMDCNHFPTLPVVNDQQVPLSRIYEDKFNCNKAPPYVELKRNDMYKTANNIKFPINVLRNVARESAQTHFVLAADIELYPSEEIIADFLKMVVRETQLFAVNSRNVYVLPIFEVNLDEEAPKNKKSLIEMFHKQKAQMFHQKVCRSCHEVPKFAEWLESPINHGLNVFASTKRSNRFHSWEPFYIGTNEEPFFEERLYSENGGDKMGQNYQQCLLDYNYWVLDNAFLVHRPGVKRFSHKNPDVRNEKPLYSKKSLNNEYKQIFGTRKGC